MEKTKIVAEIGINHNGSIEKAIDMIMVAKACGCDYVKFQKRSIPHCYSCQELDVPRESPWGTTNREQKEALEFGKKEYNYIDKFCHERGIPWFASPWDLPSLEFLVRYKPPFIKIPSALIGHRELLVAAKKTGIPLIVSTGMCGEGMVSSLVNTLGDSIEYLLHCTSTYPTAPEDVHLRVIRDMRWKYPCKIGFSNHHPGILFASIAVALGAEMVESHLTLDRSMYGSDQAASWEPDAFCKFRKYTNGIQFAMGSPVKKVVIAEHEIMKKLRRYKDYDTGE